MTDPVDSPAPRTEAGRKMLAGFSGIAGYRPRRSREVTGIRDAILAIEREAAVAPPEPPRPLPCAFCDSPDGEKWHRPACVNASLEESRAEGGTAQPLNVDEPMHTDEEYIEYGVRQYKRGYAQAQYEATHGEVGTASERPEAER